MHDIAKVVSNLRFDFLRVAELERQRNDVLASDRSLAHKDEDAQQLAQEIARLSQRIQRQLEAFAQFPHWHLRHAQFLAEFAQKGSYEDSVFIMTKYPDPKHPVVTDPKLQRVIDTVCKAVGDRHYVPRIAGDADYHAQLWDNVELHMLGCRRGIAIVQDKVKKEMNPNVAIEWGWMLGLNRRVLYLVEKTFKRERADWNGMIKHPFDWDDPDPGVRAAVEKFLPAKS